MRNVGIVGIGQCPVAEHWDRSLRDIATEAVTAALHDAGDPTPGALYVGNMLAGQLTGQENVATAVADAAGLLPTEAIKTEAACAAGGAAASGGCVWRGWYAAWFWYCRCATRTKPEWEGPGD